MGSAERVLAAIRHIHEGGEPTLERLATIAGRSVRFLEARAQAETWRVASSSSLTERRRRIEIQYDRLISEIERLTLGSEEGEGLTFDKGRVDTIMAMVKALEKIGETMRSDEDAKDKQIKDDAELAAALKRIDDKIHEIARYHAAGMGAGESGCL
ncbi:hypothetical protein GTW25_00540 [Aliihoeflea aestuarii]|jgi:DNA repair ATPase RecN|uniref:hypothetical protein n=1 Tax=Aliihoeflea aestuarii TaxID=453840 RepID=UPI002091F1F0|nr:hypothetical protein [Aliihoeflea aestuarii]MCO6389517.1 hypothetical protein [Aliihoeflea aestuarii]